jgi:hypothetical protein
MNRHEVRVSEVFVCFVSSLHLQDAVEVVGVSVSNLRQQNPTVWEVEKKGFIRRFFVQDVCYVLARKVDGLTRVGITSQSCL